ncbi:electron transport complex subunit RsxG [Candidatus Erwinia haradaeae]|uniref:Ion-translocating oxidoreductase complex subunit G n=1 Tax=Candidatus Erwinia haradaeae TaxID=1922217 RepID=A0A451D2T3_9GAMM|nr:electron transport complex subunit RsxG [Candidatus Erwinia haradaeae]VFP79964.1 Ion-translocating oxidoreductase complex subunit G [Candidatus Erwinia haradaeae]
MLNIIRKNGVILAIFAAITTGLTAIIHEVTKPAIQDQRSLTRQNLLDQVLPSKLYNNNLQSSCYIIRNPELGDNIEHRLYIAKKDEKPVAVALETTASNGYSGNIKIIVGANFNGLIYGARVLEHHETPGLGDKIELRLSNWINSFHDKIVDKHHIANFAVKKDGGDFDQFTGATITPRAVVNAVKNNTLFIKTLPETIPHLKKCNKNTEE